MKKQDMKKIAREQGEESWRDGKERKGPRKRKQGMESKHRLAERGMWAERGRQRPCREVFINVALTPGATNTAQPAQHPVSVWGKSAGS